MNIFEEYFSLTGRPISTMTVEEYICLKKAECVLGSMQMPVRDREPPATPGNIQTDNNLSAKTEESGPGPAIKRVHINRDSNHKEPKAAPKTVTEEKIDTGNSVLTLLQHVAG